MKIRYDLSELEWKLSGWTPHLWRMHQTIEIGASPAAEVPSLPAHVPGSVQRALREAGIIPDWNVGINFRHCEWVENRHWIYETVIPDEWLAPDKIVRLNCPGLDYCGCVVLNRAQVGEFCGTHVPHIFDLTSHLREKSNVLRIVFELPPRWLGQFGFTSRMTEWKARFNYTWDWTPRLVQVGIWQPVCLEITDGREIADFACVPDANAADGTGALVFVGSANGDGVRTRVQLRSAEGATLRLEEFPAGGFSGRWNGLDVELWWPNLEGDHPLYSVQCDLLDAQGRVIDTVSRTIGFRNVDWLPCEGAAPDADPWICAVNGRPVFLQGANWVPPLPNFADVTEQDYRVLLELYRDLGANVLRVWGGAVLERESFYRICDELGLMVWQEFPLSSSGIDNWPPEDETSIETMTQIARSYIRRRQHHPSLILWCGGNELQGSLSGAKTGGGRPCDCTHPMLERLRQVVADLDPTRRFVPTSSSGPRFCCNPADWGKGLHWDVHGPWKAQGDLDADWTRYWTHIDALFCSETGAPGASSAEIIRESAGDWDTMPADASNPLWRRTSTWWIEWDEFIREIGREPESLEEYVDWSQARQAKALLIAAASCKERFPRCGGFIVWMGHDCFPCTANTAVIDFHRKPKPAALALKKIWRTRPGSKSEGAV